MTAFDLLSGGIDVAVAAGVGILIALGVRSGYRRLRKRTEPSRRGNLIAIASGLALAAVLNVDKITSSALGRGSDYRGCTSWHTELEAALDAFDAKKELGTETYDGNNQSWANSPDGMKAWAEMTNASFELAVPFRESPDPVLREGAALMSSFARTRNYQTWASAVGMIEDHCHKNVGVPDGEGSKK